MPTIVLTGRKGAATSGNRGHYGRPGKVGGSRPRNYADAVTALQNNSWLQDPSQMWDPDNPLVKPVDPDSLNRVGLQAIIDYDAGNISMTSMLQIIADPASQKLSKMAPINPNAPSTAKFNPKLYTGNQFAQQTSTEHDPTDDFKALGWIIPDKNDPNQTYVRSAHKWIESVGMVDKSGKQAIQDFKDGKISEDALKAILTMPKPGVKPAPKGDDAITKAKYTDPKQLPSYAQMNQGMISNTSHNGGDGYLHAIVKDQGFDGKPQVITKAEFAQYVKSGEIAIYRGTSTGKSAAYRAQRYKDFREGDYYAGYGIHGNGTYASTLQKTARDYDTGSYGNSGIMAMTLKKGAKVIDEDAAVALAGKMQLGHPDSATKTISYDIGRVAAAHGYDAIRVPNANYNGYNEDFYVVLNRTALRVVNVEFKKSDDHAW